MPADVKARILASTNNHSAHLAMAEETAFTATMEDTDHAFALLGPGEDLTLEEQNYNEQNYSDLLRLPTDSLDDLPMEKEVYTR